MPRDVLTKREKLREIAQASLSATIGRFLVDSYYRLQRERIAWANQATAADRFGEPCEFVAAGAELLGGLEEDVRSFLEDWVKQYRVGRWLLSIRGVGPVIAAGALVGFNPLRAKSAGSYWRFAGLDPTLRWERGQKRPFCMRMKTYAIYRFAETQIKLRSRGAPYGELYERKRAELDEKNAAGAFRETADALLSTRNGQPSEWWKRGMLSPGHIRSRARRWMAKLFLSHLYHVQYYDIHGREPPEPYAIAYLGHVDWIKPANWSPELHDRLPGKPVLPLYQALAELSERNKLLAQRRAVSDDDE